jgi:hypothetical protein
MSMIRTNSGEETVCLDSASDMLQNRCVVVIGCIGCVSLRVDALLSLMQHVTAPASEAVTRLLEESLCWADLPDDRLADLQAEKKLFELQILLARCVQTVLCFRPAQPSAAASEWLSSPLLSQLSPLASS